MNHLSQEILDFIDENTTQTQVENKNDLTNEIFTNNLFKKLKAIHGNKPVDSVKELEIIDDVRAESQNKTQELERVKSISSRLLDHEYN